MCGKRRRSAAIISAVSSTDNVVCVMYATFVSEGRSRASTSPMDSTRMIDSGASPIVPSISSCPAWPIRKIV
jgi:hypothetical protein